MRVKGLLKKITTWKVVKNPCMNVQKIPKKGIDFYISIKKLIKSKILNNYLYFCRVVLIPITSIRIFLKDRMIKTIKRINKKCEKINIFHF